MNHFGKGCCVELMMRRVASYKLDLLDGDALLLGYLDDDVGEVSEITESDDSFTG